MEKEPGIRPVRRKLNLEADSDPEFVPEDNAQDSDFG